MQMDSRRRADRGGVDGCRTQQLLLEKCKKIPDKMFASMIKYITFHTFRYPKQLKWTTPNNSFLSQKKFKKIPDKRIASMIKSFTFHTFWYAEQCNQDGQTVFRTSKSSKRP
ncbi:uncharacterized protein LOC143215112 [Lasioglossum baleicum]|uniref:uncharacterized protein LOC143215112 n=1 Tax=Lasioglossum baleicum TaxID=434251 RepID=UPI003FCC8394